MEYTNMNIDFFYNEERIANWVSWRICETGPGGHIPDDVPISVPRRGDHFIREGIAYRVAIVAWCKYDYVQVTLEELS